MSKVDYKELKDNCFMRQADKDRFSLRLRIAGGNVETKYLQKVIEIADKYGDGNVHLTSRQCIEITNIKLEDIEAVKEELVKAGLRQGVCGARVRTITACQGASICQSGLIDTKSLAEEFDRLYYAREVPHKFKIGITGCRNNCLKAEENDVGVKGAMKPAWLKEKCTYCGLCETVCHPGAIQVDKANKTLTYDESQCILCGRCVKKCPSQAWEGKSGFIVYFGGLFGNKIQIGEQLLPAVFSTQELHFIIEKTIEFFKEHGKKGERFGILLNRMGWDVFKKFLDETLQQSKT